MWPLGGLPRRLCLGHVVYVAEDLPFYALRSPLAPAEVLARLGALGPLSEQATTHLKTHMLEISLDEGLLSSVLEVCVEERPAGSYVSVRLIPNRFVRDLLYATRCVVAVVAAVAAAYAALSLRGLVLAQWLLGIGALLAALLGLTSWLSRTLVRSAEAKPHHARMRYQLGEAICR